jgi:hypothetical protein
MKAKRPLSLLRLPFLDFSHPVLEISIPFNALPSPRRRPCDAALFSASHLVFLATNWNPSAPLRLAAPTKFPNDNHLPLHERLCQGFQTPVSWNHLD